jgi:ATP-binding cassette, subfamily B (MDR/TAP), member 1
MENSFEEKAAELFETSVGFAGECVGAIRTVSALNMGSLVEKQFGDLISEHCKKATRYALTAMVWFSISEAIELLCMGLAFWYAL